LALPPNIWNASANRFYQVDPARVHGSTGLGLALASWIIRQHHGTLNIESEPGQGSTFCVTLPLAHERNDHAQAIRRGQGE
jgi:signal transduction histidine kinase